jgi:ATP-dependent RNA helicase DeaD
MADKEVSYPQSDFDENYSYTHEVKEKSKKNLFNRDKDAKDKDTVRLFFNIGNKNRVMKKDFVGAIANETGFPSKIIGNIDMFDDFTFIDIPSKYAKEIVRKMKSVKIRGMKVNVEIAKKKNKLFS